LHVGSRAVCLVRVILFIARPVIKVEHPVPSTPLPFPPQQRADTSPEKGDREGVRVYLIS
jgi:hypothetical protein